MNNLYIDADFWLTCVECIEDIADKGIEANSAEYSKFKIGIEIETNCLVVNCSRHNKTIKLFRLAEEEKDLLPSSCDCCSNH